MSPPKVLDAENANSRVMSELAILFMTVVPRMQEHFSGHQRNRGATSKQAAKPGYKAADDQGERSVYCLLVAARLN